jgi:hypothetical protein
MNIKKYYQLKKMQMESDINSVELFITVFEDLVSQV